MTIDALKLFDSYGLRAQLFPAIIAGLPTLGLLLVLVPWDHFGLPHALASVMTAVLMFAFTDLARRLGRKIEAKLGTRSTPQLLFYNNTVLDEPLKARYRAFLAKRLGSPAPTEHEEISDPEKANRFYNSGAAWLRERTRDTRRFKLLFLELASYGFRRNLLGLRPFSLAMNAIVVVSIIFILIINVKYFYDIANIETKLYIVAIISLFHSLYMAFGVSKDAVLEASIVYGRQLLLCCEAFMCTHGNPAGENLPADR